MDAAKINRRFFLQGLCVTGIVAQSGFADPVEYVTVRFPDGPIRGIRDGPTQIFKGIRYAANPSGALRFRAPQRLAPRTEVIDALDFGAPSVQTNHDYAAWVDPKTESEDCLFLNVWAPTTVNSSKKPVMVWIHGGGYTSGSGGLALYEGGHLSQAGDVIVVTVNHRLNAFGYLWLGDLDPQFKEHGNLGQRDLVMALQWVSRNIGVLGGDSDNVTLFGESGGGAKINALLATPCAKGLFHKAIIQSGSQLETRTREAGTTVARAFFKSLALDERDTAGLLALSAPRIKSAASSLEARHTAMTYQPVIDGDFMIHQSWSTGAPVESQGIPLVIGTNSDEAAAFLTDMSTPIATDADLIRRLIAAARAAPPDAAQIERDLKVYRSDLPDAPGLELLVAMSTDGFMWNSAIHQAEFAIAATGAPVYMYEFAWKTPCFNSRWALHGIEIPFVFGNLIYGSAWDGKDSDALRRQAGDYAESIRLAQETMMAWSTFARTGVPGTASMPWAAYTLARRSTMTFGKSSRIIDDPHRDRRLLVRNRPIRW